MGELGDFARARGLRMNPFAFDVRYEHVGPAEHAVARVNAAMGVETDFDVVAADDFHIAHRAIPGGG